MVHKIIVYKSTKTWDKKNPFIVKKGDITASFKTMKEAKQFVPEMKHKWLNVSGNYIWDDRKIKREF